MEFVQFIFVRSVNTTQHDTKERASPNSTECHDQYRDLLIRVMITLGF